MDLMIQGRAVPALGFGTWQLRGDACVEGVVDALAIGYRHIDTATLYDNEAEVGRALARAALPRAELFLTTKVWRDDLRPDAIVASCEASLRRLGVDHLDLLLLHWPSPTVPLADSIGALERLVERGLTRHLGVSNFPPALLRQACALAPVFCNQIELHPFLRQPALRSAAADHDLMVTAYSPLARGRVVHDPTLRAIAEAHGRTPAQVALRWLLHGRRVAVVPKAASPAHRRANLDALTFALSADEIARIDALDRGLRLINPAWAPRWDA